MSLAPVGARAPQAYVPQQQKVAKAGNTAATQELTGTVASAPPQNQDAGSGVKLSNKAIDGLNQVLENKESVISKDENGQPNAKISRAEGGGVAIALKEPAVQAAFDQEGNLVGVKKADGANVSDADALKAIAMFLAQVLGPKDGEGQGQDVAQAEPMITGLPQEAPPAAQASQPKPSPDQYLNYLPNVKRLPDPLTKTAAAADTGAAASKPAPAKVAEKPSATTQPKPDQAKKEPTEKEKKFAADVAQLFQDPKGQTAGATGNPVQTAANITKVQEQQKKAS
jgi:hypothetical protein